MLKKVLIGLSLLAVFGFFMGCEPPPEEKVQGTHQQQQSPIRPPEPYPEGEKGQTSEMLHQQTGISDSDLKKFARAQAEIEDLRKEYTGRLSRVRDEYKAGLIQQEYGRQMAAAVENAGLSIDRYNQILRASRMNPLLREKIEALSR